MKSLAAKMLKIMEEVGYVQKSGYNDKQNYKFAKEADIVAKVRESMIKHGVFAFSSVVERPIHEYTTKSGSTQFLASVDNEVTFIDSESGESKTVTFPGHGADTGDKAIYKAITGSEKYALLKTFLIETGDDPENDTPEEREKPKSPLEFFLSELEKRYPGLPEEQELAVKEITNNKYTLNSIQRESDKIINLAITRLKERKNA